MSRVVTDPIYGEETITAPQRLSRPNAMGKAWPDTTACPFCPGNEDATPPEVFRSPAGSEPWKLRVVPNRYPIFLPPDGTHEVLIETTRHSENPLESIPSTSAVLSVALERIRTHYRAGYSHALWFKNQGAGSGASLEHAHSHITATSGIPPRLRRAVNSFEQTCPICMTSDSWEILRDRTMVLEVDPYSRFPYGCRIRPLRHSPRFEELTVDSISSTAALLGAAARALKGALPGSGVNFALMTAPSDTNCFHCHLDLIPRVASFGGLEFGAGLYVNMIEPETALKDLRKILGS